MIFALPVLERVVMRGIRKVRANRAAKKNDTDGTSAATERIES